MSIINSYKHHWLSCNDCGNIFRKRKKRYIVPCILHRSIASIVLPKRALNKLYPMEDVINNEERFYDHYSEDSKLKIETTKWEGETHTNIATLKRYGINLEGKNILDISGGPGFVALELEEIAKKVVVTEYSEVSVNAMKKNLGVNAVKFDYQNDIISNIFKDKFDIVFINFSINFCIDLKSFINDLTNILSKNSIVYVSFVPPTLGCCIRWQHDEYTYNVLYHPETMGRLFSEEGFQSISKITYRRFWYLDNMPLIKKLFLLPYYLLYTVIALMPQLTVNKELVQKDVLHIYKYVG
jgi:ubiquinone/menaquinone biosynthesis C-methylase UbiE|tara:strand:- start:119 stop:1009 length:891 start_codon:yes stop_codon:yes gene_type:complete